MSSLLRSALVAIAMFVVAGCTGGDPSDAGPSGACPPTIPSGSCPSTTGGPWCEYGTQRCRCFTGATSWSCETMTCPEAQHQGGQACTQPGLMCLRDAGASCVCVGPELVWCCGGPVTCPGPNTLEGSVCCMGPPVPGSQPCTVGDAGTRAVCVDNHWRFYPEPSADAGRD